MRSINDDEGIVEKEEKTTRMDGRVGEGERETQ